MERYICLECKIPITGEEFFAGFKCGHDIHKKCINNAIDNKHVQHAKEICQNLSVLKKSAAKKSRLSQQKLLRNFCVHFLIGII